MITRCSLTFFAAVALVAPLATGAELTNPVPAYLADKAARQEALDKVFETALAELAVEEKAGRITSAEATNERAALERIRSGEENAARRPGRPSFPPEPSKNEARLAEIRAPLKAQLEKNGAGGRDRLVSMQAATSAYALQVLAGARTPADLAPALEAVHQAREVIPPQARKYAENEGGLPNLERLLLAAQGLLQAWEAKDVTGLRTRLNELNPARLQVSPNTLQPLLDWREGLRKRVNERLKSLKTEELSALLVTEAPAEKFEAFAEEITFITGVAKLLAPSYQNPGSFGLTAWVEAMERNEAEFAQAWARVAQARADGRPLEAKELAAKLGPIPKTLTPAGLAAMEKMKAAIYTALEAAEKTARAALDRRAHEILPDAKNAAELLAFATSLETDAAAAQSPGNASEMRMLAADLREIAPCLGPDGADARGLLGPRDSSSGALLKAGAPAVGWLADLQALRERVYRAWFARHTESPELLAAPLGSMPLKEALGRLAKDLFAQRAWPRLFKVTNTREGSSRNMGGGAESEDLRGLRALITGQNFELAEQYADAVQSYRQVLACIGDLVPVDAAADRLKALKKAHPKLFPKAPAPPAR